MAVLANNKITFKANINLAFQKDDKTRETIDSLRIVYIMMSYDYYKNTTPMMLMSLSVNVSMYEDIINYQKTAKFFLEIEGYNALTTKSLSKKRLSGVFRYICQYNNQAQTIKVANTDFDDTYMTIVVGLISDELVNSMRTPFNGIYRNTTMKQLLGLALNGTSAIIEPISYDYSYNQILVPACTSRLQFLKFLFNYDQFYDTQFRFFMDYDKCYLLSQAGRGVKDNTSPITDIILDVRPITDEKIFVEGYEIRNNAYYLYISETDINVTINSRRDQIVNKVISYGERRNPAEFEIDSQGSRIALVRAGSSDDVDADVVNQLQSYSMMIELNKMYIDDSIIQPNRQIIVKISGSYEKYSGNYLLYYKKVFFKATGGEFNTTCNIGLIPIGDQEPLDVKTNTVNKKSKAVSSSSTKSRTSNVNQHTKTRSEYNNRQKINPR